MSWLVVTEEGKEVGRFRLDPGAYTVGRSPTCEIPIEHRALSRNHARIEHRGDSVVIRDLGSQNGTWVNGQRTSGPTAIRAGDEIKLGHHHLHLEPEAEPRSQSRKMVAVLTVRAEGSQPASFAILSDEIVLGRADDVDVTLPSPKVSREHCRLRRAGGFFVLTDENSQNGTFFQQKRITRPVNLAPGDTFLVEPFSLTLAEQEMDLPDAGPPSPQEAEAEAMPTAMFLGPAELRDLPSQAQKDPSGRKAQLAQWQKELREQVLAKQKASKPPPLPAKPHPATGPDEWNDVTGGQVARAKSAPGRGGRGTITVTLLSGKVLEAPITKAMMTVGDTPGCDIRLTSGDYPTGASLVAVATDEGNLALIHLGRGQPPVVRGLEVDRALLEPGDIAVLGSFELRFDR